MFFSPARAYCNSPIRSRAHSTSTYSKSSHAHSQQRLGSESLLAPGNNLQHLDHPRTSAPASRMPFSPGDLAISHSAAHARQRAQLALARLRSHARVRESLHDVSEKHIQNQMRKRSRLEDEDTVRTLRVGRRM